MSKKYPVSDSIKETISNKMDALLQVVQQHFPDIQLPPITITYRYSGYIAGWALPLQYHINFHPVLLNKDPQYFIDIIVGHELAHIVTHHLYGYDIETHGREWASIMSIFGLPPEEFHEINVDCIRRKVAKYSYMCKCPNKVHRLGARWNKAIRVDGRVIICTECNDPLIPTEPTKINDIIPPALVHETKTEKARWICEQHSGLPRTELIQLLIEGAGLSMSGASTYYHNLTSGVD